MMKDITIDSLLDLRFLSAPAISPDGAHTAYVVTVPNRKDNGYDSCLHILDNVTGENRQLTYTGKERDFVWEDAHTLLFAAERGEDDKPEKHAKKTCFYRLDIRGGEAHKAFEISKDVSSVRPLGDGKYLVNATVNLNALPEDADETDKEDEKDYHVLEEVPFWGNGRGYISRMRSTLYIFNSGDGSLEQISGDFFDVTDFDVQGGRIAYIGCEFRDVIDLRGSARLYDTATKQTVSMVEDGKYGITKVAFAGASVVLAMSTLEPWGMGQLCDFYRYDLASGALTLAAQAGSLSLGSGVLFDARYGGGQTKKCVGDDLYFIAQEGFRCEIYRLRANGVPEKAISFDGVVLALDADEKRIAFIACPANGCGELYIAEGGRVTRKTNFNDAFFAEHYVAKAQHIPFTNSDGVEIDGWMLVPRDFDPNAVKKYPAILEIHGGPRCTYGEVFYHEMQAFVGAGYIVFFCNPRGSEGYGEAFADLRGKYGTIDYRDLMEFTDHVLATCPAIDPTRLGASGGSYGGFMCNWIEGHTDRFAAIASQRSVSNWVSDFGSSEIGVTFDSNEMAATPWTDMEKMWEQSPLKYAHRAKTPILFIHSLCDYNCTVDQGVEMFTAMKYFKVPSRMVLFEGENHSLSRSGKPRHRIRRLVEMLNWFDKYAKRD